MSRWPGTRSRPSWRCFRTCECGIGRIYAVFGLTCARTRSPEPDEEGQLMALVEQLTEPMAAYAGNLRDQYTRVIYEVYQRIKGTHAQIDGQSACFSSCMREAYLPTWPPSRPHVRRGAASVRRNVQEGRAHRAPRRRRPQDRARRGQGAPPLPLARRTADPRRAPRRASKTPWTSLSAHTAAGSSSGPRSRTTWNAVVTISPL